MHPSFATIQPSLPRWDIEGIHVFRDMYDLCPEFFDSSVLQLVNEKYLSPFSPEADTLLVRSAMGTGKTCAMTNWVREQLAPESTTRVFFIVPRISMADRILGGLREKGIDAADYRTTECSTLSKSTAQGFRCFVVCTESIVKFLFGNDLPLAEPQPDRWPEACTLLDFIQHTPFVVKAMKKELKNFIQNCIFVMDESESIIPHMLTSPTFHNKQKISLWTLYYCVKNARKVLLMDAGLSTASMDLVSSLRPVASHKAWFLVNRFQPEQKTVHFSSEENDRDRLVKKIVAMVRSGKNVFVTSDSKRFIDVLENNILALCGSETKILKYTSDTNSTDRRGLASPNEVWKTVQVVLCSPTVVYGTDFSGNTHFFAQFHVFMGNTINPASCFQQMGRVRVTQTMEVYVHVAFYSPSDAPQCESVHDFLVNASIILNSTFNASTSRNGLETVGGDTVVEKKKRCYQPSCREIGADGTVLFQDLTFRLFLWTFGEQFKQSNRLMRVLMDMCKNVYYKITREFPDVAGEHEVDLKKTLSKKGGKHAAKVPLPGTFAASGPEFNARDDALTSLKVKAFEDVKNQRERHNLWELQKALGFLTMEGWGDSNTKRPVFVSTSAIANRVLENFALLILDPEIVLNKIRVQQKVQHYMSPLLNVQSVHFALCLISFFWPSPLLVAEGSTNLKVFWPRKENDHLVNHYMQTVLDSLWFGEPNYQFVVKPKRASDCVMEKGAWTRIQVAHLLKDVLDCVFGLTVHVCLDRSHSREGKNQTVQFNVSQRDSILECLWARRVNHPQQKEILTKEQLFDCLRASNAKFQWKDFTKIDVNPAVYLHSATRDQKEIPLILQDDPLDSTLMDEFLSQELVNGVDELTVENCDNCAFLL
jgi:hypothetical protein